MTTLKNKITEARWQAEQKVHPIPVKVGKQTVLVNSKGEIDKTTKDN